MSAPLVGLALQQQPGGPAFLTGTLVPMILIFAFAYFLLIRPVQSQRKEQAAMRSALKAGDEVLTTGGVYGTVTRVREDRVTLRIADGVQVELAKSAIVSVITAKDRE